MAKNTANRTHSIPMMPKRMIDLFIILFLFIGVFTFIALITYNQHDASWSHSTGSNANIANLEGPVGAWVADVLYFFIGYMAYAIPLIICACIKKLYLWRKSNQYVPFSLLNIIGTTLLITSSCALISLHLHTSSSLPTGLGGALGQSVAWTLLNDFNVFGSTLILLTGMLCGALLVIQYTWITDSLLLLSHITSIIKPSFSQRFHTATESRIEENRSPPILTAPKPQQQHITLEESSTTYSKTHQLTLKALPPIELLDARDTKKQTGYTTTQLRNMAQEVETRLRDFGIEAQVAGVKPGPVITRFELNPAAGTKVSRISALAKDLARALSVPSVRIVEVIPGKSFIGLELPNLKREKVRLRELLSSQSYQQSRSPLPLALGKDISGCPAVVDLGKMPHLLVAGTTGAGKSVALNAMLLSLIYHSTPQDLRLILIDPKMLELSVYNDIPHLLTPVVTDMKEAASALRWCVHEMERRYQLMSLVGVRNLVGYNDKLKNLRNSTSAFKNNLQPEEDTPEPLPHIVILVDEFADMMMVVGKKVEQLIARIAQKARAAGIHLILATQRPSVDVITGLIKANIPTRIAFQVSSRIDSRTILDQQGAEQLLGHGDMLYLPPGTAIPVRIHGAYVSDEEVHRVVNMLKKNTRPEYIDEITAMAEEGEGGGTTSSKHDSNQEDALYDMAVQIVIETRRASISNIQRRLKIGYNRAANIVDAMEKNGVVSKMESNGNREILINARAQE